MNNARERQSSFAQNELKLFCTIDHSKISSRDPKLKINWNAVENAIALKELFKKNN